MMELIGVLIGGCSNICRLGGEGSAWCSQV